jgi:hypothetical protein
MRSKGPALVCFVLAALAFAVIICIVTPPVVLRQATALLGFYIHFRRPRQLCP